MKRSNGGSTHKVSTTKRTKAETKSWSHKAKNTTMPRLLSTCDILLASALLMPSQNTASTKPSRFEKILTSLSYQQSFHQLASRSDEHRNGLHPIPANTNHQQISAPFYSNFTHAQSSLDQDFFLAQIVHSLRSGQDLPHTFGARSPHTG